MSALLSLARQVLRQPASVRTDDPRILSRLLLLGAAGAATFGATIGSLRGGWMMPYAALKLPLVLVLATATALPMLHWFDTHTRAPRPWSELARTSAVAIARVGLTLLVGIPFVWVTWATGPSHGAAVRTLTLVFATSVVVGIGPTRLLPSEAPRCIRWGAAMVLLLTLSQSVWALRPFVGAPGRPVTLVAPMAGNPVEGFFDPEYAGRRARLPGIVSSSTGGAP